MSAGVALQLALDSLAAGALLALLATAIRLAYAASGVVHLAAGDVAMAGALGAGALDAGGVPAVLAGLAGVGIGAGAGALAERLLVAPVARRAATVAPVLLLLGGVLVRQADVTVLTRPAYPFPAVERVWRVGDGVLHAADIVTVAAVALTGILVAAALRSRRLGVPLRATAAGVDGAELAGVATDRVRRLTFAAAGALGTIALLAAAGRVVPAAGTGGVLGLEAVAAALAGGLGRAWGPVAGGLAVGTVEVVVGYATTGAAGRAAALGVGVVAVVALRLGRDL